MQDNFFLFDFDKLKHRENFSGVRIEWKCKKVIFIWTVTKCIFFVVLRINSHHLSAIFKLLEIKVEEIKIKMCNFGQHGTKTNSCSFSRSLSLSSSIWWNSNCWQMCIKTKKKLATRSLNIDVCFVLCFKVHYIQSNSSDTIVQIKRQTRQKCISIFVQFALLLIIHRIHCSHQKSDSKNCWAATIAIDFHFGME